MPLTRSNVPLGVRFLLPLCPVFALAVGVSFIATPPSRMLSSAAMRFVNSLVPVPVWGYGFVAVAALLVVALIVHNRNAYQIGLAVMCVWMLIYTAALGWAALAGGASFSAWTWPAFIAAVCWALMLTLADKAH